MAEHRTRKQKETPHYNFLYSWEPKKPRVNREKEIAEKVSLKDTPASNRAKRAELSAKEPQARNLKRDIIRSLITISLILALELVVYLAWNRFRLS